MGIRPHYSPPSPSVLSTTSLPDALSLATAALAPWLHPDKPKPLHRELRTVANALARLRSAISLAAASAATLFDRVAASDAKAALVEIHDIATRARAASAVRPRIKLDWRHRDRRTHLFYTPSGASLTSVSPPSSSQSAAHHRSSPDLPFPADERKRIEAVANRLDTLLQVALWKGRHTLTDNNPHVSQSNSCVPKPTPASPGRIVHRKGSAPLRPRLGRHGRVFSNGDMPTDALPKPNATGSPLSTVSTVDPSQPSSVDTPWHFSLIESPITPLRSRSIQTVEDGQTVLAMWRGQRVSVKIIRNNERRFKIEADYMHSLGLCPNISSLLGANWEHFPSKKKHKQLNANTGYLVTEVTNGVSLDKLVRQSKISDTVTKIRLLERVVAALVFAQKLNPLITHQDLHPGNVLLIPSHPSVSSPSHPTSQCADPAPIFAAGERSSLSSRPTIMRTVTTSTSMTISSMPKTESQSTLPDASTAGEVAFCARATDVKNIPRIPTGTELVAESPDQPSSPTSATTGGAKTSTSTIATCASPPVRSTSQTSSSLDENSKETGLFSMNASNMAAFTVKVMDFASALECEGTRQNASWERNEIWSGYCPPEKVTKTMRQQLQTRQDKERERPLKAMNGVKGRSRSHMDRGAGRPEIRRSRHSVTSTIEGSSDSNRDGADMDKDVYIMAKRCNSNSHRAAHDSETYGLFGDDHLGNAPDLDMDGIDEKEAMEPDICMESSTAQSESVEIVVVEEQSKSGRERGGGAAAAGEEDCGEARGLRRGSGRGSGRASNGEGKEDFGRGRIDVWSVGWLLYYMCTGRHPAPDAWTRRSAMRNHELRDVPVECRDIVTMCVEPNNSRRACLRDIKRLIDSKLQRLMFAKGVSLLQADCDEAFVLLDKAVGIQTWVEHCNPASLTAAAVAGAGAGGVDSSTNEWQGLLDGKEEGVGLNEKTRMALSCLPLVVVRRVEWEAAGRYLKVSESELQQLRRALVKGKWSKGDVRDGAVAVRYLEGHALDGVSSAQSALGWLYRWGAAGKLGKDISKAVSLWRSAAATGDDAEACNGLGLLFHHGRGGEIIVDGGTARHYYEIAVEQGYTAAAVNLGVLLHDGAGLSMAADGIGARRLYELACCDGDGIAANNLGLLMQHGGVGVERDAVAARQAYEEAIVRKERHHACRNLGELLWDGGEGVKRERHVALDYFAMAINRGDASSRTVAISRLKRLVASAKHDAQLGDDDGSGDGDGAVLERAQRLLREVESLHWQ